MKQTLSERFNLYIKFTGLKPGEFGKKFSALPQEVSNWTNGKKISLRKMTDMFEAYPNLNGHWFLTGHGEMLVNKDEETIESPACLDEACLKIKMKLEAEILELKTEVNKLLREKIIYLEKEKDSSY